MWNVCTNLLKSCYTYVVIKTFEKRRFPSLLTDRSLNVLFVRSRNQMSGLEKTDWRCCVLDSGLVGAVLQRFMSDGSKGKQSLALATTL